MESEKLSLFQYNQRERPGRRDPANAGIVKNIDFVVITVMEKSIAYTFI